MSIRQILRRSALLYAASALALISYCLWPWIRSFHNKFGPLPNYRVFEIGKHFDGIPEPSISGWRQPVSRWELLTTRYNDILCDHKTIEREARQYKHRLQIQRPPEPLPTTSGDNLDDFVIDFGDSYGHPESYEQLEHAIAQDKAQRTSSFFASRWLRDKPYYGRIPTSLCVQDTGPDRGSLRVNQFQMRTDFTYVDVYLKTPRTPQVWIVASGGFYNARQAVFEQKPPIAFDGEEYWAAVYAGSAGSEPRVFVVDRVDVGKNSAEILIYRTPHGGETADIYPYWFFVPLGRPPNGSYSVKVRLSRSAKVLLQY